MDPRVGDCWEGGWGSTCTLAAVEDAGRLKIKERDKQPQADAALAHGTVNNADWRVEE